MRGSDIFLVMITLSIFTFLIVYNQMSVSFKNLKEQWPLIRCNPMAMPFASLFGFNTSENFTYCVQDMQTKYLTYLLQPLNYNFGVVGSIASSILTSLDGIRKFIDKLRTFFTDIIGSIFGVFLNILVEVQRLTINIKDMVGKMVGILAVIMYTIEGSMFTMQSTWKGPPGQAVRAVACFHPETKVLLKNGKTYSMKDVPLNSVLSNGSTVRAVLNISNKDENGKYIETFYLMKNGVNDDYILVTGSHFVLDPEINTYIEVSKSKESVKTDMVCDTFSCLVTSDHTIPIGKWIFHDWEDYKVRESKNTSGIIKSKDIASSSLMKLLASHYNR
jgi:hypothetical protein